MKRVLVFVLIIAVVSGCSVKQVKPAKAAADGDIDMSLVWIRLADEKAIIDDDDGAEPEGEDWHTISCEAAEFSPDDSTIISGAKFDGNMRQWDVATGNMLWDYKNCTDAFCEIEAVGYTKDGVYALFAGEEDGAGIHVRNASDGAWVRKLYVPGQEGMDCLRVSNDGTMVATAEGDGVMYIWDISDPDAANWPNSPIKTLNHDTSNNEGVNQVDWTPTDSHLISASKDGTLARFEVPAIKTNTWNIVMRYTGFVTDQAGDHSMKGVRVSNDLKYIAGAGEDNGSGRLAIWDYATGALLFNSTNPQGSQYEAAEFTDDSKYVFVGGTHGSSRSSAPRLNNFGLGYINIFRCSDFDLTVTPDPIKSIYCFRQEYIHLNSDETLMVSSHEDGTLRLWDVFKTGRTQIAQESFNETSAGGRYTTTGSSAAWGVYNGVPRDYDDNGTPVPGNPQEVELFGYQLQGYFSSDDLVDAVHTMTLNPVDVAGKSDVKVAILLAAAEGVFESDDYFDIQVDLNNTGSFQMIAAFTGTGSSDLSLDGAGVLKISKVFQEFAFDVPAGGTDLVVRVRAKTNANDEELGFDNIRVSTTIEPPDPRQIPNR